MQGEIGSKYSETMWKQSEQFIKIKVINLTNVVKVTSDIPLSFFKRKGKNRTRKSDLVPDC